MVSCLRVSGVTYVHINLASCAQVSAVSTHLPLWGFSLNACKMEFLLPESDWFPPLFLCPLPSLYFSWWLQCTWPWWPGVITLLNAHTVPSWFLTRSSLDVGGFLTASYFPDLVSSQVTPCDDPSTHASTVLIDPLVLSSFTSCYHLTCILSLTILWENLNALFGQSNDTQ